ncbi:hypothetical protein [Flagellimonas chongwuensis]|uniref:hypothetical protein n=1 Tax=Flagellimonas chongwuensis TaxID=2697365 RepID=UPI001C402A41|nr:hypothetical protein [Allomuricauda chongwuensis]
METETVTELIIDQISSQEKEGATNEIMKMKNRKKYVFSDFYKFKGAKDVKIKSITSYVIGI